MLSTESAARVPALIDLARLTQLEGATAPPMPTRLAMLLSLVVAVFAHGPACSHGPQREVWDRWTKPEATEQERARDFADCRTHGQSGWYGGGPVGIAVAASMAGGQNDDVYRACMIARGWQWNEQPVTLPPSSAQ